jgi:putative peptidoglycan lipid II flippase
MGAFRAELARAMRLMFLLTIPSTIGLMMLAEPIMSVLYQHGRFDAHQAAEAGGALRFYAIGLAGYAELKVLVNAFYALDRRKTPMIVSFCAVALNLTFNWIFTFQLGWGHRGLAFSTGCVATSNFLLLYALMRRQLGSLESRKMIGSLLKIAAAGAALAAVCAASTHWLLADWPTQAFWSKCAALFGTILAGGAVFLGCAALLKVDELAPVIAGVRRRLERPR